MTTGNTAQANESRRNLETILVVEDEDVVREVIRRTLCLSDYTVLEASNANEALLISEQHIGPIHLLLTDVALTGGMNGLELAERLTSLRSEIRVLYVSGYKADILDRKELKAAAFLPKPFLPDALERKVRKVLDT